MSQSIDPSNASMDQLIAWIRDLRKQDPESPLEKHLSKAALDPRRLVDIACIDLMERRRLGHDIRVEDYIGEFECLSTTSYQLDLIDAEICISRELHSKVDIETFAQRFPLIANQVRELYQLDVRAGLAPPPGPAYEPEASSTGVKSPKAASPDRMDSFELIEPIKEDGDTSGRKNANATLDGRHGGTGEFSVEVLPQESAPTCVTSTIEHPIEVPEWFITEQCVASAPGRWLIRGRDSVRGGSLALKVTALPAQLSGTEAEQLLDACESASKVRNPSWVLPSVAAIQSRHLGVIRPWVHARPWHQTTASQPQEALLRQLASVAFCLASAHQADAAHGGVHAANLLVDHDNAVHLLDAGSTHVGIEKWLTSASGHEQIMPLAKRKILDAQDAIKLVASTSVDWEPTWAQQLLKQLREIDLEKDAAPCGTIGQILMGKANSPHEFRGSNLTFGRSWRSKLASWLTKDA